ncbi:hypothetical protein D3C86_837000 [compost metagenome]
MGQGLRLRTRGVAQQGTGRADAGGHVFDIEAGQRIRLEMRQQVRARAVAFEVPVWYAGAGAFERKAEFRAVGADDLCRRDAVQFGFELSGRALRDTELAAGQIQPGQPGARGACVAPDEHRGQGAVRLGGQQRVVRERARRDDAHDTAFDRPLGRGRIADLFADRDGLAHGHQARQVLFHGVDRQARHRDRDAVGRAALGQRQVEQARATLGVFVEHLIEVAHAVKEQQGAGLRLQAEVLLHHGGVARKGVGGGVLYC